MKRIADSSNSDLIAAKKLRAEGTTYFLFLYLHTILKLKELVIAIKYVLQSLLNMADVYYWLLLFSGRKPILVI